LRLDVQTNVADVLRDSDDLHVRSTGPCHAQSLTDGVFLAEQHAHRLAIQYRDTGRPHIVAAVEFAAREHGNAHGAEVIARDHADVAALALVRRRHGTIRAIVSGPRRPRSGQGVNRTGRFHLRQGADALQHVLYDGGATGQAGGVLVEDEGHPQGEDVIRAISGVDAV
jgi:hypothetical protein